MKHVLFFAAALAAVSPAYAQSEPIETDRPDFTEAATVVPKGRFQIENGFTALQERGKRTLGLPETLIRGGVDGRWEWRLGLPNYQSVRATGAKNAHGFGDTYLGAKIHLGPTRSGLEIALIPAVFLPEGKAGLRGESAAPEVKLCLAKELSERYSLSGMLYGAWPKEDGRRNPTLQSTLSLGTALSGRLGAFTEYAGTFPRRGGGEHTAHAGLAYRTTPDTQWDVHFGVGQGPDGSSRFIAGGYSVRL